MLSWQSFQGKPWRDTDMAVGTAIMTAVIGEAMVIARVLGNMFATTGKTIAGTADRVSTYSRATDMLRVIMMIIMGIAQATIIQTMDMMAVAIAVTATVGTAIMIIER